MAIRVLRILEYVYDNEETATKDMSRWTHGFNTEAGQPKKGMIMRSAVLPFENVEWVDINAV